MPHSRREVLSRRKFLATAAAGSAALVAAPRVVTAKKTDGPLIVGEGEHQYEVQHDWPQLPERFTWQTTHNVAVDRAGCLYVIHEGRADLVDHPAIFVFDPDGRYIRSFGQQFQGGGHGIEVRAEGGQEFLYVCAYQHLKTFAKLDLKGETVWQRYAPMESGVYAPEEDTKPTKVWGRDRFLPTNFAFLDDGGFLLADGYGAYYIHRYDKDAKWLSCFGGPGEGQGKFNTPHGVWVDRRAARADDRHLRSRQQHAAVFQHGRQVRRNAHRLRPPGQRRLVAELARDSRAARADHALGRQEPGRGEARGRRGADHGRGGHADSRQPRRLEARQVRPSARRLLRRRRQHLRGRVGGDRPRVAAETIGVTRSACTTRAVPDRSLHIGRPADVWYPCSNGGALMATDHSHEILKQVQALSHDEQRELVAQIEEGLRAPRPAQEACRPARAWQGDLGGR